jgi:DNA primase small subunit
MCAESGRAVVSSAALTQQYLRGRFSDYYRRTTLPSVPDAEAREWAYVPWDRDGMVRHQDLLALGALDEFLASTAPQHVYHSAARYETPSAKSMAGKGWRNADLVFDIDGDHIDGVSEDDPLADQLAAAKTELQALVGILVDDFGLGADALSLTFSGGRGYHVRAYDDSLHGLGQSARREIVEYVRGAVDIDDLLRTEHVHGTAGRRSATTRTLDTRGGWGQRVHGELRALVDTATDANAEALAARLQEYDGIGEARSEAAAEALQRHADAVREGRVGIHQAVQALARAIATDVLTAESAAIDDPVTTDTKRLLRVPGSLHGGTGLRVTPLPTDEIDGFDPLSDAVPETFRGQTIRVRIGEVAPETVRIGGHEVMTTPGERVVPECVGVFLLAQDAAVKLSEVGVDV